MLFLLRKIRRRLMQKNKFTTYLLYAIGEIVLVVIGILIAVSINNWNEERKTLLAEQAILKSLFNEFTENLAKLEASRIHADTIIENGVAVANMINDADFKPDPKVISTLLFNMNVWSPHLRLSDGVINEIISSGQLNTIQNDSLRAKLGAFQSMKISVEGHQSFINENNDKLVNYQLKYGSFRRHMFALDEKEAREVFKLEAPSRPFDYSYLQRLEYENDLMMYLSSLNAYRKGTLQGLKAYLLETRDLIALEMSE